MCLNQHGERGAVAAGAERILYTGHRGAGRPRVALMRGHGATEAFLRDCLPVFSRTSPAPVS